jgi:glycosyltransferase involved in cell wall biosynthesis
VSGPVTARPAICLNMIVRNESHIVREVLDAVAPYISSWVIVDTGSDDGTQDVITGHMADLGIPGELHERPWRDFGHNRTEALTLAQGHGDYIWVMDADDTIVGAPDFGQLDADITYMPVEEASTIYWRAQLFRDGAPVRYVGVVHEGPAWDDSCTVGRLEGQYHIESRRLGARSQDPQKYARDRDLLLAEVKRNPDDARSVFYLAQSYFDLGDFANARKWYARRVEMGGWDQEVYYSMRRVAESMSQLGAPWPDVQDAFLKAWEFRPTRAEPLHDIAFRYRLDEHYRLGYLFAERAAQIPLPEEDNLFVGAAVYAWQALDEQAICAFYIGKHTESFTLCRQLLARHDIPDDVRQRIAGNRDFSVPTMIEAASCYPDTPAHTGSGEGDVTVTLIAGPDPAITEQTLNSFLHCCTDATRIRRFLVHDAGLSASDRARLQKRYEFLEFTELGADVQPAQLREKFHDRFWLHLGQGWRFFAPENLITRLTAVLDAEPHVYQVGINLGDASQLTGTSASEHAVRRTPDAGRYLLTNTMAHGPALFDTTRLDPARTPRHTASLDEVLCIKAG